MPLFITEFSTSGSNERGGLSPVAMAPSLVNQTVAIGGASVQSAALNAACTMVRLTTDVNCSVQFGTNPTASATTMRIAAGSAEYFGVPLGGAFKIAVIANS